MKIGVLSMQGDVREHLQMLGRCGVEPIEIKTLPDLDRVDALIIPGGESTTIGKLLVRYGFVDAIKDFHSSGGAIYGTCAGMIVIAKSVAKNDQPLLGIMDIEVRRNAFGRQLASCEVDLDIKALGKKPFPAVFIRAPWVEKVGPDVEVLAIYDGHPVMVREGNLLATAFHPELTDDTRVHEYFISMVRG